MDSSRVDTLETARLALRVVIGLIFLAHGVPKLADPGQAMGFFGGLGLPGIVGPAVGVVEVVSGPLVIIGLFHRPAALALAVIITGALALVQIPRGLTPGLERDTLILAALLILITHGPGRLSLDARRGRRPATVEDASPPPAAS